MIVVKGGYHAAFFLGVNYATVYVSKCTKR